MIRNQSKYARDELTRMMLNEKSVVSASPAACLASRFRAKNSTVVAIALSTVPSMKMSLRASQLPMLVIWGVNSQKEPMEARVS
jgi:hypothetical protein